jgi:hypothetical protein
MKSKQKLKYEKMKTNPKDPVNPVVNIEGCVSKGLTKREYFATMAMQGLLAGHYEYFTGNADISVPSEIAKYAALNADALIEELNKE